MISHSHMYSQSQRGTWNACITRYKTKHGEWWVTGQCVAQDVIKRRVSDTIVSLYLWDLQRVSALENKTEGKKDRRERTDIFVVKFVIGTTPKEFTQAPTVINVLFQSDPNRPVDSN